MLGAAITCGVLAASACTLALPNESSGNQSTPDALTVFATTGYLADAVSNIAPNADVTVMVGPGGDPHTYQPSTQDIEAITNADLVLWNGLNLEAQLADQLESLGDAQLAVGDHIPPELLLAWPETDEAGLPLHDPHIWNSPEAWTVAVTATADKLGDIDPSRSEAYRANADAYTSEIAAAATEAEELLASVPEPRTLITGHDAFGYFGDTFNLEVHATDFVSTEAALSAEDLSSLATLIADDEVPVIFRDNQANPQAITSLKEAVLSRGWDVAVSDDELYADSLGAGPQVDTYLEVFRHNASTIAKGLGEAP